MDSATTPPSYNPENNRAEIEALRTELEATKLAYQAALHLGQFRAGFLARASHELRSPLNSLVGVHQLILGDLCESPEEEREFITQAHQSALKLVQYLDEMIMVSRADYSTSKTSLKPTKLAEALEQVNQLVQLLAVDRNLQLIIDPIPHEVTVWADEKRLKQALLGLLDVPISLMQRGQIHVHLADTADPESVALWLEDDRPAEAWQEPINTLQAETSVIPDAPSKLKLMEEHKISPGFILTMARSLLRSMGGDLTILRVPTVTTETDDEQNSNRAKLSCLELVLKRVSS